MKSSATLLLCVLLVACAKAPMDKTSTSADAPASASAEMTSNDNVANHEKLGTVWGDEIYSSVTHIEATRKSSEPIDITSIRYADKRFDGKKLNSLSLVNGKISMSIRHDNGKSYPIFRQNGGYFLPAKNNQTYALHYQNHTPNHYEIVASIDGLDVLDGTTASVHHVGYVLDPHSTLTIHGFRKDGNTVAGFSFGKPAESYANHNAEGDISNVGVIGTAVYELSMPNQDRQYAPPPTPQPNKPEAFPASADN